MRSQLRLTALCIVAALAAGCSSNESPTSTTAGNNRATAQCANTIGNRVWFDTNCNGIQDSVETAGPEGITVTLRNCDTQEERTTTTDANGNYAFTDVASGSYVICVAIPSGYKASLEDEGTDDNVDSDINTEGCTGCRTYDCEADDVSRDAGLCVDETGGECTGTVGNRVWFDTNCNGIQDKDETGGPEGIKVILRNCDTGESRGTATDASGFYEFADVATGNYEICIEIPGGFAATLENQGDNDGVDSDIDTDGCTGCRPFECGSDDLSRDAGLCEKKGPGDDESCSAKFWKDHPKEWKATGYSPHDKVSKAFDCDLGCDEDDVTLEDALKGKHGSLLLNAVAALLNASHPDIHFGLTVDEVLDAACDHDKETLKRENEAGGCPLACNSGDDDDDDDDDGGHGHHGGGGGDDDD